MVMKRRKFLKGNDKSFEQEYHLRISFNNSPYRPIKRIFNQRTQVPFNFLNKKISNRRIKKVRSHARQRFPRRKPINNQRNNIKNIMSTLKIKTGLFKLEPLGNN
ncbi:hypothetical protein M9H77_16698 [Catharanthus roseus]|uniref:Uncharacterized protein n=1 Tax=Catharanthus roseus TaxID=4058 RepID=A0ACC0B2G4_CATRO|nr:hypothetical protein M9H77_16698 [Catharanthus roseus]